MWCSLPIVEKSGVSPAQSSISGLDVLCCMGSSTSSFVGSLGLAAAGGLASASSGASALDGLLHCCNQVGPSVSGWDVTRPLRACSQRRPSRASPFRESTSMSAQASDSAAAASFGAMTLLLRLCSQRLPPPPAGSISTSVLLLPLLSPCGVSSSAAGFFQGCSHTGVSPPASAPPPGVITRFFRACSQCRRPSWASAPSATVGPESFDDLRFRGSSPESCDELRLEEPCAYRETSPEEATVGSSSSCSSSKSSTPIDSAGAL
mmetsp:Transcript_51783/g.145936  ORF Transcript_51783/g.145936 Transcript_51783/m.145936 type:complete len:263 (+) Transcript_51783:163-951(+)